MKKLSTVNYNHTTKKQENIYNEKAFIELQVRTVRARGIDIV